MDPILTFSPNIGTAVSSSPVPSFGFFLLSPTGVPGRGLDRLDKLTGVDPPDPWLPREVELPLLGAVWLTPTPRTSTSEASLLALPSVLISKTGKPADFSSFMLTFSVPVVLITFSSLFLLTLLTVGEKAYQADGPRGGWRVGPFEK